ncbi:MAG: hypothetical protein QHH05_03320 [Syntrophomonadaceae bacterium]|nr:hypothetical protein [Syntrophomonadaceae bacterium]MDH7497460.1 hypothetical protein [Syntrophomonadaceae bacterium]
MTKRRQAAIILGVTLVFTSLAAWLGSVYLACRPSTTLVEEEGDLDADGIAERYRLQAGQLEVSEGDAVLWQSPAAWEVACFALGDATGDGTLDLCLSVWKEGSYGHSRPFWAGEDDSAYGNHLFVYRVARRGLYPLWQSSQVERPITALTVIDGGPPGTSYLLIGEAEYGWPDQVGWHLRTPSRTTAWQWNGWGFSRVQ